MTACPCGKSKHLVHFGLPGLSGGSFILLIADKQEHKECKDDDDGADAAPERRPVELQPRSSSGRSMFLLLLACLFSFHCCLSGSAFDLHILKLMELMKDVEAEVTEKQLMDQLPLS